MKLTRRDLLWKILLSTGAAIGASIAPAPALAYFCSNDKTIPKPKIIPLYSYLPGSFQIDETGEYYTLKSRTNNDEAKGTFKLTIEKKDFTPMYIWLNQITQDFRCHIDFKDREISLNYHNEGFESVFVPWTKQEYVEINQKKLVLEHQIVEVNEELKKEDGYDPKKLFSGYDPQKIYSNIGRLKTIMELKSEIQNLDDTVNGMIEQNRSIKNYNSKVKTPLLRELVRNNDHINMYFHFKSVAENLSEKVRAAVEKSEF